MELDSTPEVAPSALPERIKEECHKEAYPSVQTCDEPQSQTATNYTDRGASAQDDGRRKGYSLWTLIAVGLATAIVVGAAVGGGLGSQLGRRQWYGRLKACTTQIVDVLTKAVWALHSEKRRLLLSCRLLHLHCLPQPRRMDFSYLTQPFPQARYTLSPWTVKMASFTLLDTYKEQHHNPSACPVGLLLLKAMLEV